jgi:hypothetical protein
MRETFCARYQCTQSVPKRLPNQTLQRMGGTVAVPTVLVQTQVGGGFTARC